MLQKQANSRKQGDVGLGDAIAYFTTLGYTVCIPLTDSQKYDLVIDDGSMKRVQVKTTYFKTKLGVYSVMIKTCGGNRSGSNIYNFDNTACDYLYILTDAGDRYLIPALAIQNKTSINLGGKYQIYKV